MMMVNFNMGNKVVPKIVALLLDESIMVKLVTFSQLVLERLFVE